MAYATGPELQVYLGGASLPSDTNRLLERASDLIDYTVMGKLDPNNVEQMEVAKNATCAQVEYWLTVGEQIDVAGSQAQYYSISIGTYQATSSSSSSSENKSGTSQTDSLAPRAKRILFLAGMLYRGVRMI